MNTLSQEELARASKSHTRLLLALGETQQKKVALAIGCDVTKISKMKHGDLEQFCQILAVCGLKIVPTEYKALDRELVNAMLVMNQKLINRVHGVDDLAHDELSRADDKEY